MSSNRSDPYEFIPSPAKPVFTSSEDDPAGLFLTNMVFVHNVFIRGLNSIWRNTLLVKPSDARAFAGYCLTCLDGIDSHHRGEELFAFPFLQTKLEMSHNIEQHEAFRVGMDGFSEYMNKVKLGRETYDGAKARELLEAFTGSLVEHLHDEISTISPERMKVFDDDQEGVKNMIKALQEHGKAQPGKLAAFPFIMAHHDSKEAPRWPPAPAAIVWFARNIAPWWHYSYWKFAPFDAHGVPQKLYGST